MKKYVSLGLFAGAITCFAISIYYYTNFHSSPNSAYLTVTQSEAILANYSGYLEFLKLATVLGIGGVFSFPVSGSPLFLYLFREFSKRQAFFSYSLFLSLSVLELDFLTWANSLMTFWNFGFHTTALNFLAPFSFLTDDLITLGLVLFTMLSAYFAFKSLSKLIQIMSLALIPLLVIVYLLNPQAINLHVANIFTGLPLTNQTILLGCIGAFSISTIYRVLISRKRI